MRNRLLETLLIFEIFNFGVVLDIVDLIKAVLLPEYHVMLDHSKVGNVLLG